MCLCMCHIWFLCALPSLASVSPDHVDVHSCAHVHTQIQTRAQSQTGPSGIPSAQTLLSRSALCSIHPPSTHHAIPPKEQDSFHTTNGYRKRNIFILIIPSTQGFFWYSPTLCPFIALNDGRYLKKNIEGGVKKKKSIYCSSVPSLQSRRGRRKGESHHLLVQILCVCSTTLYFSY